MSDSDQPTESSDIASPSADAAVDEAHRDVVDPSTNPGRRRRPLIVVCLVIAVLVVGISAVVGWNRYQDRAPVRAVEAYLETVQDGDVEAALEYFEDPPRTVGAHFLTPEALNSDWSVDDVSLDTLYRPSYRDDRATVSATISGPHDSSVTGQLELARIDGEWLITEDPSRMSVSFDQLPMIEVNGFNPGLGPSTSDFLNFFLLPGLYEYYADGVEGVEPAVRSELVLGGNVEIVERRVELAQLPENALETPSPQIMTLSDDATELLQSKLESYLDDCFADIDGEREFGCPIGASATDIAEIVTSDGFAEVSNLEWELVEYPQVEAYLDYDPAPVREVQLRLETEGTTGLTAEVEGETVSLQCPLPATFIQPHFDLNGELYLGPREERDDLEQTTGWHSDAPDWRECEEI